MSFCLLKENYKLNSCCTIASSRVISYFSQVDLYLYKIKTFEFFSYHENIIIQEGKLDWKNTVYREFVSFLSPTLTHDTNKYCTQIPQKCTKNKKRTWYVVFSFLFTTWGKHIQYWFVFSLWCSKHNVFTSGGDSDGGV